MQDTFARATHSAYAAARPSARATIGYLVYKIKSCIQDTAYRRARAWPSGCSAFIGRVRVRAKVSCIQNEKKKLWALIFISAVKTWSIMSAPRKPAMDVSSQVFLI